MSDGGGEKRVMEQSRRSPASWLGGCSRHEEGAHAVLTVTAFAVVAVGMIGSRGFISELRTFKLVRRVAKKGWRRKGGGGTPQHKTRHDHHHKTHHDQDQAKRTKEPQNQRERRRRTARKPGKGQKRDRGGQEKKRRTTNRWPGRGQEEDCHKKSVESGEGQAYQKVGIKESQGSQREDNKRRRRSIRTERKKARDRKAF